MSVDALEMMRSKALSVSGVSALIGSRIYAQVAPTNTSWPFVVMGISKQEHAEHMTGASGWAFAEITMRIYAQTNESCRAVATALRVGLHNFAGSITVESSNVNVGYLGLKAEADDPLMKDDGSAVAAYTIRQDWAATIAE